MEKLTDSQQLSNLAVKYKLSVQSLEQEWAACKQNYNRVEEYIDEMVENGDLGVHDLVQDID